MRVSSLLFLSSTILLFSGSVGLRAADTGGKLKDAESATHSGDAARHQIVDTYKYPGFKVIQRSALPGLAASVLSSSKTHVTVPLSGTRTPSALGETFSTVKRR